MKKEVKETGKKKVLVLACSSSESTFESIKPGEYEIHIRPLPSQLVQEEYIRLISAWEGDTIVLADTERLSLSVLPSLLNNYFQTEREGVGYWSPEDLKRWGEFSIRNFGAALNIVMASPVLIGKKADFLKAYVQSDLADSMTVAAGYSLQKNYVRFKRLTVPFHLLKKDVSRWKGLGVNYTFKIPFHYLFSGNFFRNILTKEGKGKRNMVYRMFMILFACFTFVYMPYISKDYGISGDEFVDHRHAEYVLDYFKTGDKAALSQPRTALHLYGISMQVVAAFICERLSIENYYEVRHVVSAINGAAGVLFAGLLALRWGGGLCGLLSVLLLFFTPRYFGHSMNNLKDIPFAVGYIISVYYTIRLFDYYPFFRWRHMLGLILGIALALGTRSGGLILYPMVFMYAGLFYVFYYKRDFYKINKRGKSILGIWGVLLLVGLCSYCLAIALWPFALQKPFSNVLLSLKQFTNFSIGLRTIFDGKQMMSNMLPWQYAPKYLMIGIPLVSVLGFWGYWIYALWKRQEFSLISYFLLFAAVFPVIWVIYKHSNLYGGIRHLLFVMPIMVVVAARFWDLMFDFGKKYLKGAVLVVFMLLLGLPVVHAVRNHPNEYVYYNEFVGGVKGAYGDFETDYYFNSLKESCDWFKKHVELPKDKKTIIVTQLVDAVTYYFRRDTNVKVIYSRYYEKYSKNWDYAIFANSYISRFQLQNRLFPPEGTLYTPLVEGCPMSYVGKRVTKTDLEGFQLERAGKFPEALEAFERYTSRHKDNEEVWSRMGKLYYTLGQIGKADTCLNRALSLHPALNEALYMGVLTYLQQKDYKKAMERVGQMLAVNSMSADAYYLRALVYFNMKKYQAAIDDLNKVLSFRPDLDRALLLAGDILRINRNYKQALQIYDKLMKKKPDINVVTHIAECYCFEGKFNEAKRWLNEVEKIQPGYFPAYKVWLRMSLMQDQLPQAGKMLARLEAIDQDAELFVLRGLYFQKMQKPQEASRMFEEAIKLEPDHAEAKFLVKNK